MLILLVYQCYVNTTVSLLVVVNCRDLLLLRWPVIELLQAYPESLFTKLAPVHADVLLSNKLSRQLQTS